MSISFMEDNNDVIAEVYSDNSEKSKAFREKLSKHTTGRKPKTILTTYVKEPEKNEPTKQVQLESLPPVQHCCPCLTLASSSVVQPMIQIQNALENKIASLVDTLKVADAAEKAYVLSRYCTSTHLHPENNVIVKASHGGNTDQQNKKIKECNLLSEEKAPLEYHVSQSNSKSNEDIVTLETQKKKKKELDNKKATNSAALNVKRSSVPKRITPSQMLLQTPIARRKPPQPLHCIQKGNANPTPAPPRMSKKGCALLREILDDHEMKDTSLTKADMNLSAISSKEDISSSLDHRVDKYRFESKNRDMNSNILHAEVEHLMKKTTDLKENLKEVNKDVEKILEAPRLSRHIEKKEVEKIFLRDISLSEECPIDKYLVYHQHTELLKVNDQCKSESGGDDITNYIASVLQASEEQRKILENNIDQVIRNPGQFSMFAIADPAMDERQVNTVRIKKAVNQKIIEIEKEIQVEMKNRVNTVVPPTKSNKRIQGSNVQLKQTTEKSTVKNLAKKSSKNEPTITSMLKAAGKQPQSSLKTPQKKLKTYGLKTKRKNITEPPPSSSTAYDELIAKHFGGRQFPIRSTQKPSTQRQKTTISKNVKNTPQYNSPSQNNGPSKPNLPSDEETNKFFFQPQVGLPYDHDLPVAGNLFPIATRLVEPSTDPSLRLPIRNKHDYELPDRGQHANRKLSTSANVGVINIKHDDTDDSQSSRKDQIKAKVRKRLKEKLKLKTQVLPNVDIDTSEASTTSSSMHSLNISKTKEMLNQKDKMFNGEDVNSFHGFVAVQDIACKKPAVYEEDENEEGEESIEEDGVVQPPVAMFDGTKQNVPTPPPTTTTRNEGNCFGSFASIQQKNERAQATSVKTDNILEQKAQEWLEQELLSRIIVQLDTQSADPTLKETADNAELHHVDGYECEDNRSGWIDDVIGLRGIQLFVDAGIPVDRQLIADMTQSVIMERLESMFGFPEPGMGDRGMGDRGNILSSNHQVDSQVPTILQTPIRTPDMSRTAVSAEHDVQTPLQSTISDLEEQSLHETQVFAECPDTQDQGGQVVVTPLPSDVDPAENDEASIKSIPTPDNSTINNNNDILQHDTIRTPDVTEQEDGISFMEQHDFTLTEDKEVKVAPEPHNDTPIITPALPPSPIPSPSTPSSAFTFSSSTAVGLSMFGGISEGEHLLPDDVISDENYSEGDMRPVMMALAAVENIVTDFTSDTDQQHNMHTKHFHGLLQKERPVTNRKTAALRSEGEFISNQHVSEDNGDGRSDDDRTIVDDDPLSSLYESYEHVAMPTNKRIQSARTKHSGKSPPKLSEGEYISQTNDTSYSRDTNDILSIGQLLTKEEVGDALSFKTQPSQFTPCVVTVRSMDADDNDEELRAQQFTPRVITVRSMDADNDELPPPQFTPRVITVRSVDANNIDNDFNFNHQSVDNQLKSEGKVLMKSRSDANVGSTFGETDKQKPMIPGNLSTALTQNDISLISDEGGSLSEYDISTLSGGEL